MTRSQHHNLDDAFTRLTALLREAQLEALPKAERKEKEMSQAAKLARLQEKKAQSKKKADRRSKGDGF